MNLSVKIIKDKPIDVDFDYKGSDLVIVVSAFLVISLGRVVCHVF